MAYLKKRKLPKHKVDKYMSIVGTIMLILICFGLGFISGVLVGSMI